MQAREHPPGQQSGLKAGVLPLVAGGIVWALFVANVAYDWLRDSRVTGFSFVVFMALLAGTIYAHWRHVPSPTPIRFVWVTYALVAVALLAWAVYFVLAIA